MEKNDGSDSSSALMIAIIALILTLILLVFIALYCYQNKDILLGSTQPDANTSESPTIEAVISNQEDIATVPSITEQLPETTVMPSEPEAIPPETTVPTPQQEPAESTYNKSTTDSLSIVNTESDISGDLLFEHVLDDKSYYDQSKLRILYTYDRIVLLTPSPESDSINALVRSDSDRFLSKLGTDDLVTYAQSPIIGDGYFYHTAKAAVTNNSHNIFSICITTVWMMGGVHNQDYYGLNYNISSGQPVNLCDLFVESSQELTYKLQNIAIQNLTTLYGEYAFESDWKDRIHSYTLSDFNYFFANNELILSFPTYSLSSGAAGAFNVATGLRF